MSIQIETSMSTLTKLRSSVYLMFETLKETPSLETIAKVNENFLDCYNTIKAINIPPDYVLLSNKTVVAMKSNDDPKLQGGLNFLEQLHKKSTLCSTLLNRELNMPKRSHATNEEIPISFLKPIIEPLNNANTSFKITDAFLHISLRKVLNATFIIKNMNIEWVIVMGIHEDLNKDYKMTTESRYKVFQMIQHQAQAAILHFCSLDRSELSIEKFLKWFISYSGLFSNKCNGCGLLLKNLLPPTCRHFLSLKEYHFECQPW